jgi:formiminotetrahydrofolate cyclodeaminase
MDHHDPSAGLEGGGELSARTLALAAGVVADAARRSAPDWDGADGAEAQGAALARRAVALGVANEKAYRGARAALAGDLPSAPAATRDHLLGDIVERAARAPLELARAAADTATLAAHVAGHAPGPAAADAIAAAAIAAGVARAATHLVAVNLATRSDGARLAEARREVRRACAALPEGL